MKFFNYSSYFSTKDQERSHAFKVVNDQQCIEHTELCTRKNPETGVEFTLKLVILRAISTFDMVYWDVVVSYPNTKDRFFSFDYSQNFIENDGLVETLISSSLACCREGVESGNLALRAMASGFRGFRVGLKQEIKGALK